MSMVKAQLKVEGVRNPPHHILDAACEETYLQWQRLVSKAFHYLDWSSVGDMLPADELAARHFDGMGEGGKFVANLLRTKGRERWVERGQVQMDGPGLWKCWWNPEQAHEGSPIALMTVYAAWHDVIKGRLAEMLYPAVSSAVIDQGVQGIWQSSVGTLNHHRLARWLVHRTFARYLGTGARRDFVVAGGYRALTALINNPAESDSARVAEAAEALAAAKCQLHCYADQPWLQMVTTPSAPGRQATVSLEPCEMLWPGVVSTLPKRTAMQRLARELVPVPLSFPPLSGRARDQAAQCTLQMLVLQDMRRNARVFAQDGCLTISKARWEMMAEKAGLPGESLPDVLAAWSAGDADALPFLTQRGPNAYGLAANYGPVADFLRDSARREQEGLLAQQASKRQRSKLLAKSNAA